VKQLLVIGLVGFGFLVIDGDGNGVRDSSQINTVNYLVSLNSGVVFLTPPPLMTLY